MLAVRSKFNSGLLFKPQKKKNKNQRKNLDTCNYCPTGNVNQYNSNAS